MNRADRLVWSESQQSWVAASEIARARGRRARGAGRAAAVVLLAALAPAAFAATLPGGGHVRAGDVTISRHGQKLTIKQGSHKGIINWRAFSVGRNGRVQFKQPDGSAITLNRVTGDDPSQILGSLNANGQVWIINPNGIVFGKGARVNVGGIVASTLNISDPDFLHGKTTLSGAGTATVVNNGDIQAHNGGYVALLGGRVRNNGTIKARLGTVALGAGKTISLNFSGNDRLLGIQVDRATLKALAANGQLIQADGGTVIMTAKASGKVLDNVVNNTGIVEARSVDKHNGTITLLGGPNSGTTHVAGTLDASAAAGQSGGTIETSGHHVDIDPASIDAGRGGQWLIDPVDLTIKPAAAATIGATLDNGTDVTERTTASGSDGAGSSVDGPGDINLDAPIAWHSNATLTFDAHRDIHINASLTATGKAAGLKLIDGRNATYALNGAQITLSGANARLAIDGVNYTLIHNAQQLQAISHDLGGHYALAHDIDATDTKNWNSGAGFLPLGSIHSYFGGVNNPFTGTLDGLGHTIANLSQTEGHMYGYRETDTALFANIGNSGLVQNLRMSHPDIFGQGVVSALAANNSGTIRRVWVDGATLQADAAAGAIAGDNSGTISQAYATNFSITGIYGPNTSQYGGIAGTNEGEISNAFASGYTGAKSESGGLAGDNSGTIRNSYVGAITADNAPYPIGAVVGDNTYGTLKGVGYSSDKTTLPAIASGGGSATGYNNNELNDPFRYENLGWDIAANGSGDSVWRIYDQHSSPMLRAFLKPVFLYPKTVRKAYDGATYAPAVNYVGLKNGDTPTSGPDFSGDAVGAEHAGTYTLNVTPGALFSNQMSGYDYRATHSVVTIDPKKLTVVGATARNRPYNGTVKDQITGAGLAGVISNDDVHLADATTGTFNNRNVGTAKPVTTAMALSGGDAGNYSLTQPTLTADIYRKAVTVGGTTAQNRDYNGTNQATVSGARLQNTVAGDDVQLTHASSGLFQNKNAGVDKPVLTTMGLTGTDAHNYALTQQPGPLSATISRKALSFSGARGVSRVYDGTTLATVSGGSLTGRVDGDQVSVVNAGLGHFDNKNVGTQKPITSDMSVIGSDAKNYTFTPPTPLVANITPRQIQVVGARARDKTYDGNREAAITGARLTGAIAGDNLSLTGDSTGTFDSPSAGTDKAVSLHMQLAGADASNYRLRALAPLSATIDRRHLKVTASAADKPLDGERSASVALNYHPLNGDDVSLRYNDAQFGNDRLGQGKTVTVDGITAHGTDAGNYTVPASVHTTAAITPPTRSLKPTAQAVEPEAVGSDAQSSALDTGRAGTSNANPDTSTARAKHEGGKSSHTQNDNAAPAAASPAKAQGAGMFSLENLGMRLPQGVTRD